MHIRRTVPITRTDVLLFVILLAAATFAPYARNQFITGTIVNSALLAATAMLGIRAGLLIGIIPSAIALATGLLPTALAPMIPFVIIGNAALVTVFDYFRKLNYWVGSVSGSIVKFGLLYGTVSIVTHFITNQGIASSVAYILGWPQLVTALAGSAVSFGILSLKNKTTIS